MIGKERIAVVAGIAVLWAVAAAQMNPYPGSGTSGPGLAVKGDGWGGWRSSPEGVAYRGPYPKKEWSLKFEGMATASAVTSGLFPPIRPLLELHMRDTFITRGGDGYFYMTGTTGDNPWLFNDGVELWRSPDLQNWHYLGVVWNIDTDGTWERGWHHANGKPARAVWAPEMHYIRGNYVICLAMAPSGIALLRSRTGRPEGPYVNALAADRPLAEGTDPTLMEDDDGSVYFSYDNGGHIARLEDDLSGPAEPYHRIELEDPDHDPKHHSGKCARGLHDIGYEAVVLFRANGKYYLGAADEYEGRYSTCLAMSDRIYGPYHKRHEAVPGAGGTNFFRDKDGNWWTGYFGNDNQAPFREKPGVVRVEFAADGTVHAAASQPKWLLVDSR
ncbi:MAG TPA: family 43 glycosylhydrolase [Bryobacteraceae bacterium]|nr:family 43 glycosylhydrolase [Bryobacteraceae bacterium]